MFIYSHYSVTFHLIYKHVLQMGAVEVNESRAFYENKNEISIDFKRVYPEGYKCMQEKYSKCC